MGQPSREGPRQKIFWMTKVDASSFDLRPMKFGRLWPPSLWKFFHWHGFKPTASLQTIGNVVNIPGGLVYTP